MIKCSTECIFVNDVGTIFKVTIEDCDTGAAIDLSVATSGTTVKQIIFKKADGTVVTHTAEFDTDGSDGVITYTIQDGDVDMSGTWFIQVHIEGTVTKNSSSIDTFVVQENL